MAIDLALSRAFLNASTELISGFGAPFLTAIPIGACASVTVLPPTSLATRTSLSTPGLAEIATSIASSAATFSSILPAVAYSIESLWPDDFSKAGPSSCSTGRIAAAHSTFNSAAPAGPAAKPASSARAAARRKMILFPTFSSPFQALGTTGCPAGSTSGDRYGARSRPAPAMTAGSDRRARWRRAPPWRGSRRDETSAPRPIPRDRR